jgi:hypothetical protein
MQTTHLSMRRSCIQSRVALDNDLYKCTTSLSLGRKIRFLEGHYLQPTPVSVTRLSHGGLFSYGASLFKGEAKFICFCEML